MLADVLQSKKAKHVAMPSRPSALAYDASGEFLWLVFLGGNGAVPGLGRAPAALACPDSLLCVSRVACKNAAGHLAVLAVAADGKTEAVALSADAGSPLAAALDVAAKVELDWASLYHNTTSDGVDEYFER